jgi:phosphotriesterase-related protein
MTVLGPVAAGDLGITLPHEHLALDAAVWFYHHDDPRRAAIADAPLSMKHLGLVHRNPMLSRDNLRLDDRALAVREVADFKRAGGGTVVGKQAYMSWPVAATTWRHRTLPIWRSAPSMHWQKR